MRRFNHKGRDGFSLIELVVVLAITLAIAAYAMPNILSTISDYRLRNTISQVSGLYQQQRIEAVRTNSVVNSPSAAVVNGSTVVWFDTPSTATATHTTGTYDAGEPMVQFPSKISVVTSGAPTFSTGLLSSSFYPQSQSTYVVRFNARGLPCVPVSTGGACMNLSGAQQVGFLIFFKNDKSFGSTGWGAITITGAGRINGWFYNGSTYTKM